jgi:acetate---CoA ligase (ADP-forming)
MVDLEVLFHPDAIAVVGASENFGSIGGKPLRNLIHHGYKGEIYPVNPKHEEIAGYRCYPSLLDVPGTIDVALLAVSQARTLEALEACAEKEVKYAMLFGAGFAEVGEEGRQLQEKISAFADENDIRVVGPNCIGCLNARDSIPMGFHTSFEAKRFLSGPVALASQSGALGYALFALAQEEGLGFSYAAHTGNQADLTTLDFTSFMLEDESTHLVASYLEGIPDGDQLIELAGRSTELGKPLLLLKAGRSELGRKAALSHTASLTGSEKTFAAVSAQYGIVNIDDVDDMIDAIKIFARRKRVRGDRVAVISTSGATGIMMADQCEAFGLKMNPLSETTRERVEAIIPSYGSAMNPVDITAQALNDERMFAETLRAAVDDEDTDAIVVTTTFGTQLLQKLCHELIEVDKVTPKPILVTLTMSRELTRDGLSMLREARIPVYQSPQRTTRALTYLVRFSKACDEAPTAVSAAPDGHISSPGFEPMGIWTEDKVKEEAPGWGLRVPKGEFLEDLGELDRVASTLDYPVVAKAISPDVLHKTDAGALRVGIGGSEELVKACEEIVNAVEEQRPGALVKGVLVEEMVDEGGVEMFIGVEDDAQFGPLVVCGLGGIFVEVLEDVVIRRAPIDQREGHKMLAELKGYPLLTGARGGGRMDLDALVTALVRVSVFAYRHRGVLKEMDLNPVIVTKEGRGVVALDGMIVWNEGSRPSA